MSINNHEQLSISSASISSQETSVGEDVPPTSIDCDDLLLRLSALHQALHGQSKGVVERLCREFMDASQGQVQIILQRDQRQPTQTTSFTEHAWLSLPIEHAGRSYGKLEIAPDPARPCRHLPVMRRDLH